MSFLKFWGKKDKKDGSDSKREDSAVDPEQEKRRLRHQLSISRSGRFKQKKRERGQILDKPELFSGHDGDDSPTPSSSTSSVHSAGQTTAFSSHKSQMSHTAHAHGHHSAHSNVSSAVHPRSPNNMCRDVNNKMTTGSLRMGQSVVT